MITLGLKHITEDIEKNYMLSDNRKVKEKLEQMRLSYKRND